MKTILVPTDLSEYAKNALRVAAQLATKTKSEIVLLNVNEQVVYANPLGDYYTYDNAMDEEYQQAAVDALNKSIDDLKADGILVGVPVQTSIESGPMLAVIETTIKEKDIDLVIMGTHGATGMEEFVVGSNTQKVIRKATCPVLSIPLAFAKTTIDTIVFPTTLKDDQAPAFKKLAEFQELFHSSINLLYMNDPANLGDDKSVDARVNELADAVGLENIEIFSTKENVFNEEDAILKFATEQKADLIAMGTHQRKGLSHLIFGSITESTLNHANIPVLSIPLH